MKTHYYTLISMLFFCGGLLAQTSYGDLNQGNAGDAGGNTGSYFGYEAGLIATGGNNTFIGHQSGYSTTTGYENSGLGSLTLYSNTAGARNTANGVYTLYSNLIGDQNTAVGYAALGFNTSGNDNTANGYQALLNNSEGGENVAMGNQAGMGNTFGNGNIYIGVRAGENNQTGSGNIFLGYQAGRYESGSDRLYIDNSDTSSPLIWGDFASNIVSFNANVGIGTANPDAALAVRGDIHTREVRVDLNGSVAPDFVFEPDYRLRTLAETERYIKENKHLPEIPSAAEMEKNGMELKEMNLKLLQKIEELTLYTIQQQKQIEAMQQEIARIKNK